MKRLRRIFELSTNEQRVVLVVMFTLIAIAFIGYELRVHRSTVQRTTAAEARFSPTPTETVDEY
jgi:hypothetical protein